MQFTATDLYVQSPAPATAAELASVLVQQGFHLCGSRYFNAKEPSAVPINSTTDWDFCGQDGVETVEFLIRNQFVTKAGPDSPYTDNTAEMVLTHATLNVQVVLRSNIDQYMAMLDSIAVDFYVGAMWKSGPSAPSHDAIRAIVNQLMNTYLWSRPDTTNDHSIDHFSRIP